MTLEQMQRKLKVIKNKYHLGLDVTKDMVKLVKENPLFIMSVLDETVDYYIDQISKAEEESRNVPYEVKQ